VVVVHRLVKDVGLIAWHFDLDKRLALEVAFFANVEANV
jgi:hypothetical protein